MKLKLDTSNKFLNFISTIINTFVPQTEQQHFFESALPLSSLDETSTTKNMGFTLHYIAIAASLAKVDGAPNEIEFMQLRDSFSVTSNHYHKIRQLFFMASNENINYPNYLKNITKNFPGNYKLYAEFLLNLISLAESDGPINKREILFLQIVRAVFGFTKEEFIKILEFSLADHNLKIFTLDHNASKTEINKAYLEAAKIYHPDKYSAIPDISIEYQTILSKHFEKIQRIYDVLKQ